MVGLPQVENGEEGIEGENTEKACKTVGVEEEGDSKGRAGLEGVLRRRHADGEGGARACPQAPALPAARRRPARSPTRARARTRTSAACAGSHQGTCHTQHIQLGFSFAPHPPTRLEQPGSLRFVCTHQTGSYSLSEHRPVLERVFIFRGGFNVAKKVNPSEYFPIVL